MKTYLLEEMTWPEIQAAMKNGCDTVVIYAASIEQHGPALPEMNDTRLCCRLGSCETPRQRFGCASDPPGAVCASYVLSGEHHPAT